MVLPGAQMAISSLLQIIWVGYCYMGHIPTISGQNAHVVLGQTNFITNVTGIGPNHFNYPQGILYTLNGRLLISDRYNNRVLLWNSIPTQNGDSADIVIGQPDFNTSTTGNTSGKMNSPWGLSLSPKGKLLVADEQNHRVLIFDSIPRANGDTAVNVIGHPGFGISTSSCTQNTLNTPVGVTVTVDGKVAVSEFGNNRVTIWDSVPTKMVQTQI